jgi:hypothetical protein
MEKEVLEHSNWHAKNFIVVTVSMLIPMAIIASTYNSLILKPGNQANPLKMRSSCPFERFLR